MQRRSTVPVPLLIGLVIGFYGSAASSMATFAMERASGEYSFERVMRWFTFHYGCAIAEMLLVTIALFAVVKRTIGVPRTLLQIAAWISFAALAWLVTQDFATAAVGGEHARELNTYTWKAFSVANLASMVMLSIASRAWTRPSWVTAFAVLGILFAALSPNMPLIGEPIQDLLGRGPLGRIYWVLRDGVLAAGVLAMVHATLRDAPPPTPDVHLAVRSFRLASIALTLRIVAAIALALLGIGLVRSTGGVKALVILGPAIIMLTTLAFAWTMLDVERAALVEMPRVRLTLGAALTAWTAGIQLKQVTSTFSQRGSDLEFPDHWTIIAPIAGIVGGILVVSAIYSFATARGDERLRSAASARGVLFAILSLAPALLPLAMMDARSRGAVLGFGVLAIVCAISAIVALAGLMTKVAESFGDAPVLPEARLRQ